MDGCAGQCRTGQLLAEIQRGGNTNGHRAAGVSLSGQRGLGLRRGRHGHRDE